MRWTGSKNKQGVCIWLRRDDDDRWKWENSLMALARASVSGASLALAFPFTFPLALTFLLTFSFSFALAVLFTRGSARAVRRRGRFVRRARTVLRRGRALARQMVAIAALNLACGAVFLFARIVLPARGGARLRTGRLDRRGAVRVARRGCVLRLRVSIEVASLRRSARHAAPRRLVPGNTLELGTTLSRRLAHRAVHRSLRPDA